MSTEGFAKLFKPSEFCRPDRLDWSIFSCVRPSPITEYDGFFLPRLNLTLRVLFRLLGWVDQLSTVQTVEISANFFDYLIGFRFRGNRNKFLLFIKKQSINGYILTVVRSRRTNLFSRKINNDRWVKIAEQTWEQNFITIKLISKES